MERLDVAEILLDEAEAVVSVPVRTRGSGNYSSPVVLLSNLNAFRRAEGNSSKNGLADTDGDGVADELYLSHIHEATATLETRAEDEVQSYELLRAVYNRLSVYEEYPENFHAELNDLSLGEIQQGGFQAPTPEPVYKHTLGIELDFSDEIAIQLSSDTTGEPITSIEDDISTN